MNRPSPVVRPVPADELPTAVGLVREVVDACTVADGTAPVDEATSLWLDDPDATGSLWLAPRGFALLRGEVLDLAVDPGARGAGVATALTLAALPSGPVSAWSHGNHPAAAALATRFGLARVRDLWVMRRNMAQPLAEVPPPREVELRTFRPGDEDALLAVNAAAFSGHPEQGTWSRADLDARTTSEWFDAAGLFLATGRDGRLLGFHWTKVHSGPPAYGEVYVLGIAPQAQGLGLGKYLTYVGLEHLVERGVPEVILYVESDNGPARAVYERLGFGHADVDTHVMYRRAGSA